MHSPCLSRPWDLCPSSSSPSNMFPHALERLGPYSRPSISIIAHTACPHAAYKVTAISPLALVHAFCQPPLAQCLTHSIQSSQQRNLALHSNHQAHTKGTNNLATNAMHHHVGSIPPAAAHYQNHLYPPWPSSAMVLGHHVEQGASTCRPFNLLINPT